MKFKIHTSEFLKGAVHAKDFPPHDSIEVAFLGRSNVGKSTLLNRLTGTRKLAKTSKTPGRTQELNFFTIQGVLGEDRIQFYLCDLPGYGFAKIPNAKKRILEKSIAEYISEREQLSVVALLIDVRRGPEKEELSLREFIYGAGVNVLPVLTKSDKLSKSELKKQMTIIAKKLSLEPSDLVIAGAKIPVETLWTRLLEAK